MCPDRFSCGWPFVGHAGLRRSVFEGWWDRSRAPIAARREPDDEMDRLMKRSSAPASEQKNLSPKGRIHFGVTERLVERPITP